MDELLVVPKGTDAWAIADEHINHKNILDYEPEARGKFKKDQIEDSLLNMNEHIIRQWNSVVKEGDWVLFGGDFFMGPKSEWNKFPHRFNSWSNVYGVNGNHDGPKAAALFPNGLPESRYIEYGGYIFWLNHYPLGEDDYQGRGYQRPEPTRPYHFALAGHTHSKIGRTNGKSLCICADINDFVPLSMDLVIDMGLKLLVDDHHPMRIKL